MIKDFELVNLLNSGSVIGTARVKSIQVVNNETRIYLMDIQMKGTVDSSVQITNVESIERHGDFDTPPHTFLVKTAGSGSLIGSGKTILREKAKHFVVSNTKVKTKRYLRCFFPSIKTD